MTLGIEIMLIALFPTSVFFRPRDLRKSFLNRDANGWRYQPGKIVLGQKGCQRFLPGILSENQSRSTRTIKPYVNRKDIRAFVLNTGFLSLDTKRLAPWDGIPTRLQLNEISRITLTGDMISGGRSEEHTSALQSLKHISYA